MSTHHISSISRREFVVGSAIAGIGLAMRADAAGIADAEWFDRPMRWAQLTLVENDPGRYDPAFWLDYFRRIHADAACLSTGGVVAYYPTTVALHHRSSWMGDGDPFGDLLNLHESDDDERPVSRALTAARAACARQAARRSQAGPRTAARRRTTTACRAIAQLRRRDRPVDP
jgi:hypothetical protein